MNLVHNAVKFSPSDSVVEITLQNLDGMAVVGVLNCGPGIEADELEAVFTRYRQGQKSGRRAGSGLGLAIARGLVEAHGGSLQARSCPGVETVFTVVLPSKMSEVGG